MKSVKKTTIIYCLALVILCAGVFSSCQQNSAPTSTISKGTQSVQSFDITKFIKESSCWATENISQAEGGCILDIKINKSSDKATFNLSFIQSAPSSRVAETTMKIKLSDITSNIVKLVFDEDGWGHSGKVQLTFNDKKVQYVISGVKFQGNNPDDDIYGIRNGKGVLISNPNAHDDISYSDEDDYEDYEDEPEETYDMSKASGILASLGMTEKEFRKSCINLTGSDLDFDDLLEYPKNYIGNHLTYFYSNGYWGHIDVDEKGVTTDEYVYYIDDFSGTNLLIYDLRDDVYSPTISEEDDIIPYMIFNGIQTINGTDYLCFDLISVDKD